MAKTKAIIMLCLDIGGTGVKGLTADPADRPTCERVRVETPHPATPEAVLGAKVEVPTLDGTRLEVKVPPGTSGGAKLRLRGKGVKGGDQYLVFKVVVPSGEVDEASRKLIEEFAKKNPQLPRDSVPWA